MVSVMTPEDRFRDGLLERDGELAVFGDVLDRVRRGNGAVVLVEGPAGIGKTSLLDACARAGREREMVVLCVRGDLLVQESSFAAIRELLWAQVGLGRVELDGAARLAKPVFATEPMIGGVDGDRAGAVLHGLYWLVAGLAERAPLVLILDDAHWLDAASERFVRYLAGRIESLAALLVVGLRAADGRTGVRLSAGLAGAGARVLRPAALSEDASAAVVRTVLGARVDEELCRSCHEVTGGNPFYLRELTVALAAERGVLSAHTAERVRALGARAVARSVLVRVVGQGSDCERLAQAVAVLGHGAPLRQAARLAGLGRERAEVAADGLRAAELLGAGLELWFVHPIVSEVILTELADSRRSSLHREAARVLLEDGAPRDRVAAHLLSVEPFGERWVVEALRDAGREALAQGAPEAALSYLRRALAEPPAVELRLAVLVELGRAEAMLPSVREFSAFRQALDLAADASGRAEIAVQLAEALIGVGRFRSACDVLEKVLEEWAESDAPVVERILGYLIGGGAYDLRRAHRANALAASRFGRGRDDELGDPVMLAALANNAAATGRACNEVTDLARAAMRDPRVWGLWAAARGAIHSLIMCDQLDEASEQLERAFGEAQRRGSTTMFIQSVALRSLTALRVGELDIAEEQARRAIDLAHDYGDSGLSPVWLGEIYLEQGRSAHAAEQLEQLDRTMTDSQLNAALGVTWRAERGKLRIALGQLETGLGDVLDADRRMTAARWQLTVLSDWVTAAVLALLQLDRAEQARKLAERELAEAVRFAAPRRHGIALALCGTLAVGGPNVSMLDQATRMLERSPARLEHARALVSLGAGLHARGDRDAARAPLSQALDIAHRLGSEAVAQRARDELISTGARPRRDAQSGPGALTPAELRTARMAAQGQTNREIAQALFVSARTVEAQLHQAYTKLGITGRGELREALSVTTGAPFAAAKS